MVSITVKTTISLIQNIALKLINCSDNQLNICELKRTKDNTRNISYSLIEFSSSEIPQSGNKSIDECINEHIEIVTDVLNKCKVFDKLIQNYIKQSKKQFGNFEKKDSQKDLQTVSQTVSQTVIKKKVIIADDETLKMCNELKMQYLQSIGFNRTFIQKFFSQFFDDYGAETNKKRFFGWTEELTLVDSKIVALCNEILNNYLYSHNNRRFIMEYLDFLDKNLIK